MAAYKATMKIDGNQKDYKVISCSYGFRQNTDSNGHPNSEIKVSEISVLIESINNDHTFWDWGADKSGKKGGTINFLDDQTPIKKLTFTEGFVTGYSESFGGSTMTMSINITCRTLNGGTNAVENDWTAHD